MVCKITPDKPSKAIHNTTFFINSFHFQAVDWLTHQVVSTTPAAIIDIKAIAIVIFTKSFINDHIKDENVLDALHGHTWLPTHGMFVFNFTQAHPPLELIEEDADSVDVEEDVDSVEVDGTDIFHPAILYHIEIILIIKIVIIFFILWFFTNKIFSD